MTIYYLYVKTHNKTGLKYLGQTSKQNPFTYVGSGKDWVIHLNEHGSDISTQIIFECCSKQKLNEMGRYYSNLWDVANSPEWANIIPETGGGSTPTEQTREKLRDSQLGRKKPPRTETHRQNLSNACKGISKPRTSAGLKKWYSTNPDRSETFRKQSTELKSGTLNIPIKQAKKQIKLGILV